LCYQQMLELCGAMAAYQLNGKGSRGKTKLRRLGYVGLGFLCVWLLVGYLATMPVVGNHPFWRQIRARPQDFGLNAEDVYFPADDGIVLHAWYIPAESTSRGTVILAHGIDGNASDMLPRAWFLARDHYNTLVVDLRAHGESRGNYATPGYLEARDILGSLSYLRHGRHQGGPIAVFGHSYGSVAALYAASRTPDIAAVIADGAFISFEKMMRRATILLARDPDRSYIDRLGLEVAGTRAAEWAVIPIYFLRTEVWPSPGRSDLLSAIPDINPRPILFIAGEEDEICPPENARLMYEVADSPHKQLLIVPGAEHDQTYAAASHLYEKTVVQFLNSAL
jgi:pimeloyl-ACP methyl ester carboxylesterase